MVTDAFSDFVVGHGELWCAQLLTATLKKMGISSAFMDTREVLVVTPTSDGNSVDVDYEESNARLDRWGQKHGSPSVSPPFLTGRALCTDCDTCTLSASIVNGATVIKAIEGKITCGGQEVS